MTMTSGTATFTQWRAELNDKVEQRLGCSIDDCPDQPTRDWYEGGLSPTQAFNLWKRAMREEGMLDG